MARYTVKIFPPQELNHSSYVQTGLFELEQMGLINVEVGLYGASNKGQIEISQDLKLKRTSISQRKTSFYLLKNNSTGQVISFAVDLYDHADKFSLSALQSCDYIFKRNYQRKYINALGKLGEKVHRFGLTFSVVSSYRKKEYNFLVGLLTQNLKNNLKLDRQFVERIIDTYRKQVAHWRMFKTTRPLDIFKRSQIGNTDIILFQTRCFPQESHEDVREIHTQRYSVIKLLQKEFPQNFQGGFVPSQLVEKKYSDVMTNLSANPTEYLNSVKKAKFVVYTRGLANSPAWKMAEYLSLGKIILAEPLHAELPVSLEDGKHLLYFTSEEELIGKIKNVMSNERLAMKLSDNARHYFEAYVHPVQNVRRILELMLDNKLQ